MRSDNVRRANANDNDYEMYGRQAMGILLSDEEEVKTVAIARSYRRKISFRTHRSSVTRSRRLERWR